MSTEASDLGDKVIVIAIVFFFDGEECVYVDSALFKDEQGMLKSEVKISQEIVCSSDKKYDRFELYYSGVRLPDYYIKM